MTVKILDLSKDPGWQGRNNRLRLPCLKLQQNFGWQSQQTAGGDIYRCNVPAYYADTQFQKDLTKIFGVKGRLRMTGSSSGGAMLGLFNSATYQRGYRPPHFLGFSLDGRGSSANVSLLAVSSQRTVQGAKDFFVLPANSGWHNWRLRYENGKLSAGFDQQVDTVLTLTQDFRDLGASFDRFGWLTIMTPGGNAMNLEMDDLLYSSGKRESFALPPPNWVGSGNRDKVTDCNVPGAQDFGWTRGTIGGVIWRQDPTKPPAQYADITSPLDLTSSLTASGTLTLPVAASDSDVWLGWFKDEPLAALTDFIGVQIGGLSSSGHTLTPKYVTSTGTVGKLPKGTAAPRIPPDGGAYRWSMRYDPAAALLTMTLENESVSLPINPVHLPQGLQTNRFGLRSVQNGGHDLTLFLRDLAYAVA